MGWDGMGWKGRPLPSGTPPQAAPQGLAHLGMAGAVLDEQAGDAMLLAERPEPLGDMVADEALEDQDQVDPPIANPPLDGVEQDRAGVAGGLPVDPVEVELVEQGAPDILPDAAADHQGAESLGGGNQVVVRCRRRR